MRSSPCNVPEDMEIPACDLTDNLPFFRLETNVAQPPTHSAVCIGTSTSLRSVDIAGISLSAENFPRGLVESQTTSRNAVSISIASSRDADQLLSMQANPTLSTPMKTAIIKQRATFTNLDEDVKRKIFHDVLVKQREILPLYRCGMLVEGPWAPGNVKDMIDPGVSIYENINLSLLQVNRKFNKMCSEIFYGQNNFFFGRSDICRWWVQHIGPKNFSRIRSLTLGLDWGFFHAKFGNGRSTFDLSEEEVWHSVLCWMQNRHRLQYLHVKIIQWHDLKWASGITDEEKDQLHHYRQEIISILQRYRGIKEVEISCIESRWLTFGEMQKLALLMQQRSKKVVKKRKELSLFELIKRLRLDREREEQEWKSADNDRSSVDTKTIATSSFAFHMGPQGESETPPRSTP
jgi:hypothetical protein